MHINQVGKKMKNNNAKSFNCNYNLTFIHSNHYKLKNFVNKTNHKDMSFTQNVRKFKGQSFFTTKASVYTEESASHSFIDFIKTLLNDNENLEVGGTFNEYKGEGYIDCFGDKHYTGTK